MTISTPQRSEACHRLTELMRTVRPFSFLRLGDGELAFLLNVQDGIVRDIAFIVMATELVDLHTCIKNRDVVTIVADVVETRHGQSVRIMAHGPKCKSNPNRTKDVKRVSED